MNDAAFPTRFALASLATWRVTHLLAREDGPGDAIVRIRARAGTGPVGELMDCFYCLSIWVACPFALLIAPRRRVALTSLALSGAACLLERLVPATDREPNVIDAEACPLGGELSASLLERTTG